MARPLRVEFPGAVYHVTSRGNGGAPIVFDGQDRLRRLHWLERTVMAHGWRLHAFAVMKSRPIEEVMTEVAEILGVDPVAWSAGRRNDGGLRAVAGYVARRGVGYRRGRWRRPWGTGAPAALRRRSGGWMGTSSS